MLIMTLCFVLWIFGMLIMIIFFIFVDIGHFFFTHECILTIFRQVIFVDICGCLFQFIEILWKCLGICAGATNVFLEIYLQVS